MRLALSVPARPESLPVVRVVLMSCAAVSGARADEILKRSRAVADAFVRTLTRHPGTRRIELFCGVVAAVPRTALATFTRWHP